jgi:hypothetical protein
LPSWDLEEKPDEPEEEDGMAPDKILEVMESMMANQERRQRRST